MSYNVVSHKLTHSERVELTAKYPDEVVAITDISELQARPDAWDAMCDSHCDEVRGKHKNSHMDDYYPIIYDMDSPEVCDECDTPKLWSYDKKNLRKVLACMGCIEALRLQSVKHRDIGSICLACFIRLDDFGVMIAQYCQSQSIEDEINDDSGEVIATGLKTKIAEGKVHYHAETDTVFVNGSPIRF